MARNACVATRTQWKERERTSGIARDATTRPFSVFPQLVLFVEESSFPPRHRRLTSNDVRAYVPPDTHIVDRITADTNSHHKNMLYEWGGGDAITPVPYLPCHVQFCSVDYFYCLGIYCSTEKQRARHYRRYLGGDRGRGRGAFRKSPLLWSHIGGDRDGVTTDANARGWNHFPVLIGRQSKE